MLRYFLIIVFLLYPSDTQAQSPVDFVDPFIGTGAYAGVSRWGAQGGTYPGAVLPHGMVQVTPETRNSANGRGYYYQDSTIQFFSFLDHRSGFPEGSAGLFKMMPYCDSMSASDQDMAAEFNHQNETARPGYYSVLLSSGIRFECTAASHTGFCKILFPKTEPNLLIFQDLSEIKKQDQFSISGCCHNYYYRIEFNCCIQSIQQAGKLTNIRFSGKNRTLLCKASFSTRSIADATANMQLEIPHWQFETVCLQARNEWDNLLGRIVINGGTEQQKIIFYTALYHSMLLPMLVSDQNESEPRYAVFSPWDTYQTVHPLLTLLQPKQHGEMLASLVHEAASIGRFPSFPMAGNHIMPVLADAWAKGIRAFDLQKANALVRNMAFDSSQGMATYDRHGFVTADQANSVSMTLAYAYDDWAAAELAHYAGKIADQEFLLKRALNYQNLFNPETRLMSARSAKGQWLDHIGFEEGDSWDYSWLVPHNMQDLINLMGGRKAFAEHLESHFASGRYLHDNEPSLHYAYLFNYAAMPWKTQQWLRFIMDTKYSANPGGLPGNDDLGSMSSWYVFSALGLYPACPGRPQYLIGTPLFGKATIHLQNGKTLTIHAPRLHTADMYIKSITWNGKPYLKTWLDHNVIANGGILAFTMTSRPDTTWGSDAKSCSPSLTSGSTDFEISNLSTSKSVVAGDSSAITMHVMNNGERGCREIRLLSDNKIHTARWVLLDKNESCTIKLPIVLYKPGTHVVSISGTPISIQVMESPAKIQVQDFRCSPIVRLGNPVTMEATLCNIGGNKGEANLKIYVDDGAADSAVVSLQPGEKLHIVRSLSLPEGLHKIRINDSQPIIAKVFRYKLDSEVLHLTFDEGQGDQVYDHSGLANHVRHQGQVQWIQGKKNGGLKLSHESYIELPQSASLDMFRTSITMSIWLYPLDNAPADFFCKGDYNVLKTEGGVRSNPTLSFFAGGWGRGEAKYQIRGEWANRWHHIAGVCKSASLRLYLDGELVANTAISGDIESSPFPWLIGRNAEKPGERRFLGYVDEVRIFVEALDEKEIKSLYHID
jgi:putative alpha-1,2-mannosidase